MISRLDPAVRDRIAAGEVVTRPVRVVEELVENSLDAGASRIDVAVDGDGTERIRVADDGRGMRERDAALAVERHTTSKLDDSADLTRIRTLGFRGEALPSIAAVSRLTLLTNDGGPRGTRVVVGDETRVETAARDVGTTVTVRDLFANRPPRRESLAATATEFARVSAAVSRYALVRPDVRFSLDHDGRSVLSTPGSGDPTDALLAVYDRETASQHTVVDAEATVAFDGDSRELTVSGVLCYPSVTRATTDHVHVSVNGRPVRDGRLRRAVRAGYGSALPSGREPVAVVSVSLPAEAVDPNVHPTKAEVAIRNADGVADAVESAVRDALSTVDRRRAADVAMDLDASLTSLDGGSVFETARFVGHFRSLYLLFESDDELLVVDQHAAHERVNYERLREVVDDGVPTATLDPPRTLSLTSTAVATADAHAETLARLGFDIDLFGGDTVRLSGVPAPLGRVADADALRDALDTMARGERVSDPREELLKDLACHPSLKAGDDLGPDEAVSLLDRLGACEEPYACPHGRPTVVALDEATLADGFERHGPRRD